MSRFSVSIFLIAFGIDFWCGSVVFQSVWAWFSLTTIWGFGRDFDPCGKASPRPFREGSLLCPSIVHASILRTLALMGGSLSRQHARMSFLAPTRSFAIACAPRFAGHHKVPDLVTAKVSDLARSVSLMPVSGNKNPPVFTNLGEQASSAVSCVCWDVLPIDPRPNPAPMKLVKGLRGSPSFRQDKMLD